MTFVGIYTRWTDAVESARMIAAHSSRRHRVRRYRTFWVVQEVGSC